MRSLPMISLRAEAETIFRKAGWEDPSDPQVKKWTGEFMRGKCPRCRYSLNWRYANLVAKHEAACR